MEEYLQIFVAGQRIPVITLSTFQFNQAKTSASQLTCTVHRLTL